MTKKKTIFIIVFFVLTLLATLSFVSKDYIISYIYENDLKRDIQKFKFLTIEEKNDANKLITKELNKVQVFNKFQKINNKYANFNQNIATLINPSVLKSISTYKPKLVDLKPQNEDLLTENAKLPNQSFVAQLEYKNLLKLINDANKQNIKLQINSAYRSYEEQQSVKQSLKELAAQPGESEHQSGLAVDFAQKGYDIFKDAPAYNWLKNNAYKYGFILSFSENNAKTTGEVFEQWHWRYISPRYAKIYNEELKKDTTFTYNKFITKYFGYKYVTNKIYRDENTLLQQNKITNYILLANNKKISQYGLDSFNSNIENISNILKKQNLNINKQPNFKQKTNDVFKIHDFNETIKENNNAQTNSSMIGMCKSNNEVFKLNNSYAFDNTTGALTYYENNRLISFIYLKNSCLGLIRSISVINEKELAIQRNLIYQLFTINKIKV